MSNYRRFFCDGLHFNNSTEALAFIGTKMCAEGVVKDTYPAALLEREVVFPTGIELEGHAVAIPHCDATHAKEPAICVIRPISPVPFMQADGDEYVNAELIIALIVSNPQEQMKLLKQLFSQLQQPSFIDGLLAASSEDALAEYFNQQILAATA
ncbi:MULTISPECIES: PTS galactitol transporter subunit IIA [Enterobacterales]|uniref:PTS galactitol transporter subunit IIA n=1 Tax=Enterobacterales TaxID=91347 RepID=UPI002EDB1EA9